MSAYFVSTDTVTCMIAAGLGHTEAGLIGNAASTPLRWFKHHDTDETGPWQELRFGKATEVGRMLLAENLRSLECRYDLSNRADGDDRIGYQGTIDTYVYPEQAWVYRLTVPEVINCIHNFEYQACECSDYDQSEAHAFCQALEKRIYERLVDTTGAPWGFETGDMAKRRTGGRVLSAMMGG